MGTKGDFPGRSGRGMNLITHFQLVPRSTKLQHTGAAERTPRFGRGIARGGVGVEQWGVCC
jgi:hypothetical protein